MTSDMSVFSQPINITLKSSVFYDNIHEDFNLIQSNYGKFLLKNHILNVFIWVGYKLEW